MEIRKFYTDKDKVLRKLAKDVTLPLKKDEKELMEYILEYLKTSKDPVKCEELKIRGGVGIAAPQLGLSKKLIGIHYVDAEGVDHIYGLINPKIISYSKRLAYVKDGEGCLSVEEDVEGIVVRKAFITVEYIDYFTNEKKVEKIRGYLAIIFQHEIDHLNGILYYDRINEKDPFKEIEDADIF